LFVERGAQVPAVTVCVSRGGHGKRKGGKTVKLHKILYGTAFVTGLLGYGGLAGAIENGEGLIASCVMIAICVISAVCGKREDRIKK
jgi:uncharacterized membrane protein YtjA (UPF0391 family)